MTLHDAIKQSGLQAIVRMFGAYTLVTDTGSDGKLQVYFSNGDTVLVAELGEREIDGLQATLGLNNRQGVLNLIAAALRDLQPAPSASLTQALVIPLARGSPREAELRLAQPPPANQSETRRCVFALVSARAADLAGQLESANRALEAARSGGSDAAGLLGKRLGAVAPGGGGGGVGKRVARTALPGMSLVNPMQRKRKAARGVMFAADDDSDEEGGSGSSGDDKRKKGKGKKK